MTVQDAVGEADLLRLREPLRRYLARVVADDQELDDLVQETLLRVWEVRGRVGRTAAASYAVATARNLVQSRERALQVHQRHAHRLLEPPTVDGPEVEALRQEEQVAAGEVLRALDGDDRALLADEAADRQDRERTARRRSRLARARSRARVDYLLRLRRLELPTATCRPVLEALSSGDRRQQERVAAAQHLLRCPVCASCAKPLLARERSLFGVVAIPLLLLTAPLRDAWQRAPKTTSTVAAGAVLAAAVAGGIAVQSDERPPPAPVAAPAPPPAPAPLVPGPVARDAAGGPFGVADVGAPVVARGVPVRAVPADEGFWVGPDDARQSYVRLTPGGGESAARVRPGDLVSFTGTVRELAPGVDEGLEPAEGLDLLRRQQTYLSVAPQDVTVEPRR